MILADTNVWIKHFRESDSELIEHLNIGFVACHPFIIGELACGNLGNRATGGFSSPALQHPARSSAPGVSLNLPMLKSAGFTHRGLSPHKFTLMPGVHKANSADAKPARPIYGVRLK